MPNVVTGHASANQFSCPFVLEVVMYVGMVNAMVMYNIKCEKERMRGL